jgi:hypothetical protein
MAKHRIPLPETIALAKSRAAAEDAVSPDAIIARTFARALFRALRARVGNEIAALFAEEREGRIIADPAFDAADRLFRARQILVEPCMHIVAEQPVTYLVFYPDGTRANVAEPELLAMAGMDVPA